MLEKKTTLTVYQRSAVTAVIVLLYLVACCCLALTFDNYYSGNSTPHSTDTWFGWTALFLGWLGILVGSVAWLANFVLGLTLIFLLAGLRWATLICSVVTVLLSLDLFRVFSANIPATRAVSDAQFCDLRGACLVLVCQHCGRFHWCVGPISCTENITSSGAGAKRARLMSAKSVVQSAFCLQQSRKCT
jgi:hypothetical protein